MAELGPDDLDLAFDFARSAPGWFRDASGALTVAPAGVARFDHDLAGQPLGLLVAAGDEPGQEDRLMIDPLILPADLVEAADASLREATVLHRWLPQGSTAERRDAWFTRNAAAAINALMRQAGHHQTIGVATGFLPNRGGEVRLRGFSWRTAGYLLADTSAVLSDGTQPVIVAGTAPQG